MKGTEKIIAHIRSDAKAQADAILAQAEQQCASIREDYDKKAKEVYAERIRLGTTDCQDKLESMERIDRMEARKSLLALKQELVSKSFEMAREKIIGLPEQQYIALLAKLAADASVTGDEEIVLNARDKEAIGEKLAAEVNKKLQGGKLRISESVGEFDGGLILRRGSIEVNCTIELLVELCRNDMSAKIAGVLFE